MCLNIYATVDSVCLRVTCTFSAFSAVHLEFSVLNIYLFSLPEAIAAILRVKIEERATLRMWMAHWRLILRVISIVDSPAIRRFLFDTGICKKDIFTSSSNK